jgi:hypothetical protein
VIRLASEQVIAPGPAEVEWATVPLDLPALMQLIRSRPTVPTIESPAEPGESVRASV